MGATGTVLKIEALYVEHSDWLCNWLRRRAFSREHAADLTHDTFRRLLERGPMVSPDDPRNYLVTIARRLLIDDVRRRNIERAVLDVVASHQQQIEHITPERITAAVMLLDSLMAILDGLPKPARTAFLLRTLEGLTQQDIADRMGISLRTVKRHIAMGLARCFALDEGPASL